MHVARVILIAALLISCGATPTTVAPPVITPSPIVVFSPPPTAVLTPIITAASTSTPTPLSTATLTPTATATLHPTARPLPTATPTLARAGPLQSGVAAHVFYTSARRSLLFNSI